MTLPRRSPGLIINTRVCFIWLKPRFSLLLLLFIVSIMAAYYWASLPLPEQTDHYPTARDINPSPSPTGMNNPYSRQSDGTLDLPLFLGCTYCPGTSVRPRWWDLCSRLPRLKENRPNSRVVVPSRRIPSGMTAPVSRAMPPSSSPEFRGGDRTPQRPCFPWCAAWAWSVPSWRADARIT